MTRDDASDVANKYANEFSISQEKNQQRDMDALLKHGKDVTHPLTL